MLEGISSSPRIPPSHKRKEAGLIITNEDVAIAQGRADALLRGRTEDARWNVLQAALVESNSKERESMLAGLTLDAVRDLLYPGIDRDRWRKLGWSNVLGGRVTPEDFIHKLRLAKGTGFIQRQAVESTTMADRTDDVMRNGRRIAS